MSNHFFESTLGLLGLVLTLLHSLINMASREILLKHKSDHVTEILLFCYSIVILTGCSIDG